MEKIVMVLVDGMRPDAMISCAHPFVSELIGRSFYTLAAKTVMPSVTLPCHMSLFHSVDPAFHGVTTNTYAPMPRPIPGIVERLSEEGKKCAFFITWEPLRDLARPDGLHTLLFENIKKVEATDKKITAEAISYINRENPDFTFVYLGETDEFGGHGHGWMSDGYMDCIMVAWDCIEKIYRSLPENYTLIVLSDHGGHDRTHGTDMHEDITIPLIFSGPRFEQNREISGASIKDVAPTVATLLSVKVADEWEGRSLI